MVKTIRINEDFKQLLKLKIVETRKTQGNETNQ